MDGLIRNLEIPKKARLEEFDLFSEGVGISFAGHDRSRTKVGALFSLMILGCGAYLFYYYLNGALDTTSPKIQFDVITESSALRYNITNSDFKFFLLFDDPSIQVVTQEADYGDISSEDEYEDTGDAGDASADEEERRRLLQGKKDIGRRLTTSSPESGDLFLDFDNYKKYFSIQVNYVQTASQIKGSKVTQVNKKFPIDMIPCKKASWMNDSTLMPFLNNNDFAKKTIANNGFCFNLNESHSIYGNWLSPANSAIQIGIFICDKFTSKDCDPVTSKKLETEALGIYMGSFSSTVNNSNRDAPFVYDFFSHGSLHLSPQSTNHVDILYKKIRVLTDVGTIFEEKVQSEVGIIDSVSVGLKSNFIVDLNSGTLSYFSPIQLAAFEIRGSSRIDQYSRQYDKVFDFIGNFGGAMEFIFVSATVLSLFLEELFKQRRLQAACRDQLGVAALAQAKAPPSSGCCKKRPPPGEEFAAEMVERSLSFEQLVKTTLLGEVLRESLVPPELMATAPYFLSLRLAQQERREAPKQAKLTVMDGATKIEQEEKAEDEELDFEKALEKLMSPEFEKQHPAFKGMKEKLLVLMAQDAERKAKDQNEQATRGFGKEPPSVDGIEMVNEVPGSMLGGSSKVPDDLLSQDGRPEASSMGERKIFKRFDVDS